MNATHNSQRSKVLRITGSLTVQYMRLSSDWGTEYDLTPCEPTADAEDARYLSEVELDGKRYLLIRNCGAWDVVRA